MAAEIVYCRSIGRPLKIITSPVLRKIRKEQRLKSRNVFTHSKMQNYWCECLKNEKYGGVKTLFDTSLDFIAQNAECIDSLIGIPELIGEKLFYRYLYFSISNQLIPTCDTLKTFTSVYEDNILKSLQLSKNSLVINEFLDLFQLLLPYIRELDISNCLLGDNHEIIEQIRELKCLEHLNISYNALTDKTLRRLTIMYPDIALNLKYLDLSGNKKITDFGLEKLICFQKLEVLNISGLNIDVTKISDKLNMQITNQEMNLSIDTNGWCQSLVIGLIKAINTMVDEESAVKDKRITRFYGNRPKVCLNLFNDDNSSKETVILVRKQEKPSNKRKLFSNKTKEKRTKIDLDGKCDLFSIYQ